MAFRVSVGRDRKRKKGCRFWFWQFWHVRRDASGMRNVKVSFLKEREKAQGFAETVRIGAEK